MRLYAHSGYKDLLGYFNPVGDRNTMRLYTHSGYKDLLGDALIQ